MTQPDLPVLEEGRAASFLLTARPAQCPPPGDWRSADHERRWLWFQKHGLNTALRDLVEGLRANLPADASEFVRDWLSRRPLVLDEARRETIAAELEIAEFPTHIDSVGSDMSHSELLRQWHVVRQVVVGHPSPG